MLLSALFYADDGVLMCHDWLEASRLLDVCKPWAVDDGMRLKVGKSCVVADGGMADVVHTPLSVPVPSQMLLIHRHS